MILGIDPGKRGLAITALRPCGTFHSVKCWALPKDPLKCVGAWGPDVKRYVQNPDVGDVFCEEMRYRPGPGSARASSEIQAILVLQAIGGLVCGWTGSANVTFLPPHVWKGSTPKEICHTRLEKLLTPGEFAAFKAQIAQYKKQDDCWDSLGVALSGAGRFRV